MNKFELLENYAEEILELRKTIEYLQNELAEYQRIYGPLEQGDYLRR